MPTHRGPLFAACVLAAALAGCAGAHRDGSDAGRRPERLDWRGARIRPGMSKEQVIEELARLARGPARGSLMLAPSREEYPQDIWHVAFSSPGKPLGMDVYALVFDGGVLASASEFLIDDESEIAPDLPFTIYYRRTAPMRFTVPIGGVSGFGETTTSAGPLGR